MPVKRADSPASGARIVGRRYRGELDSHEHDSVQHLRQPGFERARETRRSKCGRANRDSLRHEAHAVLKITWQTFCFHVARGVRANWSNSTRPASELTVLFPAPNGLALPGGWAGRDNASLTEPTSSHENASKTRRLPDVGCTPCWAAGFSGTQRLDKITRGRGLDRGQNDIA